MQGIEAERLAVIVDGPRRRLFVLAVDVAQTRELIGASPPVFLRLYRGRQQADHVIDATRGRAEVDERIDGLRVGAESLLDVAPDVDGALQAVKLGLVNTRDANEVSALRARFFRGFGAPLQVVDQGLPALGSREEVDARVERGEIPFTRLEAALPEGQGAVELTEPIGELCGLTEHVPLTLQVGLQRGEPLEHPEQARVVARLAEQLAQAACDIQARWLARARVLEHAHVELCRPGSVLDLELGDLAGFHQHFDAPVIRFARACGLDQGGRVQLLAARALRERAQLRVHLDGLGRQPEQRRRVRANCQRGFDATKGELRWDVPDLQVIVRGDLAVTWGLSRMRSEEPGAGPVELWSRGTRVFRKLDGRWQMVHQHVSFPCDPETGAAKLDLKPGSEL